MTPTDVRIVAAIQGLVARGIARPVLTDICAAVNLSKSPVAARLAAMVKSGEVLHHGTLRHGWYSAPVAMDPRAEAVLLCERRDVPPECRRVMAALVAALDAVEARPVVRVVRGPVARVAKRNAPRGGVQTEAVSVWST